MSGLECLGCDDVGGFDYMSLLSGAGGMLSGMFGGGGDKGAVDAEKRRLEEQKRQAEQSAANMKMALIGVAAIAGLGVVLMVTRK